MTREIAQALPEIAELRVGLVHLHILHTSASLTLNENARPDVRRDFASWFDRGYLCEHRDHGGARRLVATAFGE